MNSLFAPSLPSSSCLCSGTSPHTGKELGISWLLHGCAVLIQQIGGVFADDELATQDWEGQNWPPSGNFQPKLKQSHAQQEESRRAPLWEHSQWRCRVASSPEVWSHVLWKVQRKGKPTSSLGEHSQNSRMFRPRWVSRDWRMDVSLVRSSCSRCQNPPPRPRRRSWFHSVFLQPSPQKG